MAKINFKKMAQDELSLSPLMAGRDQIKTDDLIGQTVTVVGFDFATITDKGVEKTFPVLLLKEYPDRYYNGGALLSKLCRCWAEASDGDIEAASNDLAAEGGVQLRFTATKTKSGNNLTAVDVV
jgi:hypothetical protein